MAALWASTWFPDVLDGAQRARFGELMAGHLRNGGLVLAAVHDPLPIPARGVELAP